MSRKHRVEMATPRNSSVEHFITVPISRKIKGVNINLSRSRAPERSCDFRNRVRATKHGAWVRAALTYRCDSWREMHTPDVCTPAYDALIPRENSIWKGVSSSYQFATLMNNEAAMLKRGCPRLSVLSCVRTRNNTLASRRLARRISIWKISMKNP